MTKQESPRRKVFVLRIKPSGIDRIKEAIAEDVLITGWAPAEGLLEETDFYRFREVIKNTFYADDPNYRSAGSAAGILWKFVHEMAVGDFVLVPHGAGFHVSRVAGPAVYLKEKVEEDTAYRRPVEWLNGGKAIPRAHAPSALQSRLKARQTCVRADEFLSDIVELLELAEKGLEPSFEKDLRNSLTQRALKELRDGRINPDDFERLLQSLLYSLGATDCEIIARRLDKGADLVATFHIAKLLPITVAVQAKHWKPEPGVSAKEIDILWGGMVAEGADVGLYMTTGAFADDAVARREELYDDTGVQIELVDGEQLAALIVERGLGNMWVLEGD